MKEKMEANEEEPVERLSSRIDERIRDGDSNFVPLILFKL